MSVLDRYTANLWLIAAKRNRPRPVIDPEEREAQLCLAVDKEMALDRQALTDEINGLKSRLHRLENKGRDE